MDGYLLDMDGVLYLGAEAIPGAADFLRRVHAAGRPYQCITNHSCVTPRQIAAKLAHLGLTVPAVRILTAAEATVDWLRGQGATEVFAIGERPFLRALRAAGIEPDAAEPSHVVVGLDRQVRYERLAQAARFILTGLPFIATNPDPAYPTERGTAPECGFYLAGLERMSGRRPFIIGKPARFLYAAAAMRLGLPLARLTMVGDRLDTDIAGAQRAGLRTVLVLSGHTTPELLATSRVQPDQVVEHVGLLADG